MTPRLKFSIPTKMDMYIEDEIRLVAQLLLNDNERLIKYFFFKHLFILLKHKSGLKDRHHMHDFNLNVEDIRYSDDEILRTLVGENDYIKVKIVKKDGKITDIRLIQSKLNSLNGDQSQQHQQQT
jgi:hypothetical protein